LPATVAELPEIVDERIPGGRCEQRRRPRRSPPASVWTTFVHDANYGYGRNQTTCYPRSVEGGSGRRRDGAPDYQYTPLLVTAMASMIAYGVYDVVIGSRILGGTPRRAACRSTSTSPTAS
jgi:hypothetical protein